MADKKQPKQNDLGVPEAVETPSVSDSSHVSGAPSKKLNPDLTVNEIKRGVRPGDVYVRMRQTGNRFFRRVGPGHFIATPESNRPEGTVERTYRAIKKILIGRPLETAEEIHQRLSKFKALAVFGSDAISSSAYATEASLVILMVAGNAALGISLFTALAVAVMLSIIAFSYRQTVFTYPHGGGSYNVSRENLGEMPGLVAGASLLIDYILTVAVSIVAGSAAVTSALIASGYGDQIQYLESLLPHFLNINVILSLGFIGLMTLANLRGLQESGTIFAVVTYTFIFGLSITLIVGIFKLFTGTLQPAAPPPILAVTEPLTILLILRAFSAGAVAMSGVEAISNGVPAFQKPEPKNAATTLIVMATLLGAFFLGVTYLASHMGLVPSEETIISQMARAVYGTSLPYYIFQLATTGILIVAANTAFAGFPRLASVLARDDYMPHQFSFRGDRLAFSTGIGALGGIASILVLVFQGEVDSLIHLYAIGVLLAFSLSNSGMVIHWLKSKEANWKTSIIINGIGASLSIITLIIVTITKFALGAWIVIVLIPIIVSFFLYNHHHYSRVRQQLRIIEGQDFPSRIEQLVVVPIDDLNYASLRAIAFARTISRDAVILHIGTNEEHAEKIKNKVQKYAPDMKLVIVDSPWRAFVRPLLAYVDAVHSQYPSAFVTIVLPEFITARWWDGFLHNRSAARLREAFVRHPNVAVVLVPYLLEN
ncbi:MAG: APC family permease [Chloroflexi bacterium]|nr:APC family permease [Chloroflexota bacterium]